MLPPSIQLHFTSLIFMFGLAGMCAYVLAVTKKQLQWRSALSGFLLLLVLSQAACGGSNLNNKAPAYELHGDRHRDRGRDSAHDAGDSFRSITNGRLNLTPSLSNMTDHYTSFGAQRQRAGVTRTNQIIPITDTWVPISRTYVRKK